MTKRAQLLVNAAKIYYKLGKAPTAFEAVRILAEELFVDCTPEQQQRAIDLALAKAQPQ